MDSIYRHCVLCVILAVLWGMKALISNQNKIVMSSLVWYWASDTKSQEINAISTWSHIMNSCLTSHLATITMSTRQGVGQDHGCFALWMHLEEHPPWQDCEWITYRSLYVPVLNSYVCDHAASVNADLSTALKFLASVNTGVVSHCTPVNFSTRAVTIVYNFGILLVPHVWTDPVPRFKVQIAQKAIGQYISYLGYHMASLGGKKLPLSWLPWVS